MTERTTTRIPEDKIDILEKKTFAHVATIGPDGEPQNNPVWVDFDGEHILISQTKARQKLTNVERNPKVAISMTDPENPYRRLEVRGRVAEVSDDPDKAFIDKMAKKYMDRDEYPWKQPGEERVVVKVTPEHTTEMG